MAGAAKINGKDKDAANPPLAPMDGQDKVIATAQQIVMSLATNQSSADDMVRIFSGFDNRFNDLFPSSSSSSAAAGNSRAADGDQGSSSSASLAIEKVLDDEDNDDGGSDQEEKDASDIRLEEAESLISRWESSSDSLLFETGPEDRFEYLSAVDDVIAISGDESSSSDVRSRADVIIQIAMARLEDEFRHLMIRNTNPLDAAGLHGSIRRNSLSFASDAGENEHLDEDLENSGDTDSDPSLSASSSSSHHHQRQESMAVDEKMSRLSITEEQREIDLIHPEAVAELREIADRMIAAEYHKELCQVYTSVRRDTLDECLSVLGVDRMSIEEVHKIDWKFLDDKMRKWIQGLRVVVRVLLTGERRLCGTIFAISDELTDQCFAESSKGSLMQLLNFGDAIVICKRSPEKLFRILDMYDALSEVMLDLKELFGGDFIVVESEDILSRLGEAVRGTINEFACAVQKDPSRKSLPSGEIHPLTRYVMNYVKLLVEYSNSLDSILGDTDFNGDEADRDESDTSLGCQLRLVISHLESNLEEKAKLYEDVALQYIFLMNNSHYIIQKVKGSDLGKFLGENWVRKRRGQIRQHHNSYLRASWTRALSFLKDDGLGGSVGVSTSNASKMAIKERFKYFNLAFEEIYKTQTTWKVPDPQLREELQLSTAEKIIPAYRSFLGRYGGQLENVRHTAKYIKYTPEDLERHLLELLEGTTGLSNHLRRKSSS